MYHLPPPPPGRDCGLAAQASPAHRQGHACGLSNSSVTRSQNLSPGSWTARHSESGHPSGRTAARAQRSHERERERDSCPQAAAWGGARGRVTRTLHLCAVRDGGAPGAGGTQRRGPATRMGLPCLLPEPGWAVRAPPPRSHQGPGLSRHSLHPTADTGTLLVFKMCFER